MALFLGVDGGGTKTDFCLLDSGGAVVSTHRDSSCSYFATGIPGMEELLVRGVRSTCERAGITPDQIEYAFFGLPCYGESSRDLPALDAAPSSVLQQDRYRCGNDMICGWAGSLGARDGINVLAGTGSMAYGEHAGRQVRCGGWGELFGDEGSAYWVAIRGLAAFSRMSDGRTPEGPLHEEMRSELGLATDLDAIDVVINRWRGDRTRIAALARAVSRAADAGDAVALEIFRSAAHELAMLVAATRRQLVFPTTRAVPVSYSGGMFNSALLVTGLERELALDDAEYAFQEPMFAPAVGAALYAARLRGLPIDVDRMAATAGRGAIEESVGGMAN